MSSSESPDPPAIVMDSLLPDPLSSAETWVIPFASNLKVTSIWGIPAGAGGIPESSKSPKSSFLSASSLSPCETLI